MRFAKSKILFASLLIASAGLPTAASAQPVTGSPTPIESETSVQWVPLARINQAKPVTIELHNKTTESLEYLITTHTDFRTLAPGQTVSLIVTDLPSFLNINAKRSVGVKYQLNVKANKIMVDLRLTGGQGDTTLYIHDLGAVYLY
jgi:hypothetical protein